MLTLWNINDDDNNVVVVTPREPASLGCPVAERDTVPRARLVVRGSGGVGVPVVPTCGRWSSFGAWLSLSSLLGVRCHPFGVRWLAAGRPLPVARLSRCWGVVVVWAAGVVSGGVRCVTWQAGDMEGARFVVDVGDVGVWLSCLVFRRLSWFVGTRGCSW